MSLIASYTSVANPVPQNPAAVVPDHAATEQLLRDSGVNWAFLRDAQYAEFQAGAARTAAESGVLSANTGTGRARYVSPEDCAAVAAAVLAGPGFENEVLDVTRPDLLDANDLAAISGFAGIVRQVIRASAAPHVRGS